MRLLLAVVVALVLVPAVQAGEVRNAKLTKAVEIASGKTGVDVSCEPDDALWDAEARATVGTAGNLTSAHSTTGGSRSRYAPWVCRELVAVTNLGFVLYVVGVEAARLRGYGRGQEGIAGCFGVVWAAQLARDVFGIPFYSPASLSITAQSVRALQEFAFPAYRTVC